MSNRKYIKKDTETEILTRSARRCCLCFGLSNNFEEKQGQIAHLDHNPQNASLDNLAWLCLIHHDQFDSKSSQSKGLKIDEVKRYRQMLYEEVERVLRESKLISSSPIVSAPQIIGDAQITDLIVKIQGGSVSLSQCITEALIIARNSSSKQFEEICRKELTGYGSQTDDIPSYRIVQGYLAPLTRINMEYFGWRQNVDKVFKHMEQDPEEFIPYKIALAYPVLELELEIKNSTNSQPKGIFIFQVKMGDIVKNANKPDAQIPMYVHPRNVEAILQAIRRKLTEHLLALLPK